jgi:hypothetical protein
MIDARLVWLLERSVAEWGFADVQATLLSIGPAPSAPISGLADPKAPHRANPHFPARCPDCNGMAWCDCTETSPS